MASQRVGEASLSGAGYHNTMSYAVSHGLNPPSASFINQEGPGFDFGELEEAILLHGVNNINNIDDAALYARPAATLEMFPSCPTRLLQTPRGSPKSGENSTTDSGSGMNTMSSRLEPESPMSKNTSSDYQPQVLDQKQFQLPQSSHQQQEHQQLHMPNDVQISDFPETQSFAAKPTSEKTLRRLAQNREAARKSRLRKKAYVQQLESSRIRLSHLEQDLHRARAQGLLLGGGGVAGGNLSSGAAIFDMEYARWLDDDHRHMSELRTALHAQLSETDLRMVVDGYIAHYDEIFRLKGAAAKADVFHLITGIWSTPTERCFLWIAGFRPSELIKSNKWWGYMVCSNVNNRQKRLSPKGFSNCNIL